MSTSLLEQHESNGVGQRGHGSQSDSPGRIGAKARIDVSQNATDSFGRDRRRGNERHRRGAADPGVQSDGIGLAGSDTTRRLEELGGRIFVGHQESNVGEAQVVVVSSAVSPQNPRSSLQRRSKFR